MDKLSNLILEAKPLYKQRKRRKKILTTIFTISLPVLMIANVAQLYIQGDDVYVSLQNKKMQQYILQDDFGLLGLDN